MRSSIEIGEGSIREGVRGSNSRNRGEIYRIEGIIVLMVGTRLPASVDFRRVLI